MELHKGFNCKACNSYLSHPLDACPVCGDQFYWMVVVDASVSPRQKQEYVSFMVSLVEGRITPEFLNHGGQLWLPYPFWNYSPDGSVLNGFPWVKDLKLFQHNKPTGSKGIVEVKVSEPGIVAEPEIVPEEVVEPDPTPRKGADYSAWDTIPKMPLPQFHKEPQELVVPEPEKAAPNPAVEEAAAPESTPEVKPTPQRKAKPRSERSAVASNAPLQPKGQGNEATNFILRDLIGAILIFIFFLLLSLSYLVLRYHKNQMKPQAQPQSFQEVQSHERSILS